MCVGPSVCVYICTLHCVYLSVSQDFLSYSVTRPLNTAAPHNTHTPPLPPFTKIRNVVNFLSSPLILSLLLLTHKYVCMYIHTHTHTHTHTHIHTSSTVDYSRRFGSRYGSVEVPMCKEPISSGGTIHVRVEVLQNV